ncbi:hypothetical protein ACTZWW_16445, partial [Salinarimonas sp. NSM]|uniref:hypothetical protein n=1 Tax=Salinarimonas sp. NSM TaxID=3458003 RepID=UPI0040357D3E
MTAPIRRPSTATAPAGRTYPVAPLLRRALLVDVAASGAAGITLAGAAGTLAGPLGLPETLLRLAGVVCLAWASLLWLAAARPRLPRLVAWGIVEGNALWVLGSVALLVGGLVSPTALGVALVLAQAALVGGFAVAQARALRAPRA